MASGHPHHGTKPQSKRLRVAARFDCAGRLVQLWKLERTNPETKRREVHPTAGGLGPTWMGTESNAKATAGQYPGWELVPA